MVSGGIQPDAPQNNFGVSATGGNGSATGQPKMYIPGMRDLGSSGVETMAQQGGAAMYAAPETPTASDVGAGLGGTPLRDLFSETLNPSEPISAGVDFGRGPGSDVLPPSLNQEQRLIENIDIAKKYMPALMAAAQSADAPDSYKKFLNYLIGQLQ